MFSRASLYLRLNERPLSGSLKARLNVGNWGGCGTCLIETTERRYIGQAPLIMLSIGSGAMRRFAGVATPQASIS
jgi:hypothetical protein